MYKAYPKFLLVCLATLLSSACSHEYPQFSPKVARASNQPILAEKEAINQKKTYPEATLRSNRIIRLAQKEEGAEEDTYAARILINSTPPGARLYINGRFVGHTPAYYYNECDVYGFSTQFLLYEARPPINYEGPEKLYRKKTFVSGNPDDPREREIVPYQIVFDLTRMEHETDAISDDS